MIKQPLLLPKNASLFMSSIIIALILKFTNIIIGTQLQPVIKIKKKYTSRTSDVRAAEQKSNRQGGKLLPKDEI